MPKKPADKIVTHRLELGNFERKEFKETLDEVQKLTKTANRIAMVPSIVLPVAALGGAAALFFGMGMIAKAFGYAGDILDEVKDTVDVAINGRKSYDDGGGSPNSPFRDEDGNLVNPVHDVPILGGLFGLGMGIGSAVKNVHKSDTPDTTDMGGIDPDRTATMDLTVQQLKYMTDNENLLKDLYISLDRNYDSGNITREEYMTQLRALYSALLIRYSQKGDCMGTLGVLNTMYYQIFGLQLPPMPNFGGIPPMPVEPPEPHGHSRIDPRVRAEYDAAVAQYQIDLRAWRENFILENTYTDEEWAEIQEMYQYLEAEYEHYRQFRDYK